MSTNAFVATSRFKIAIELYNKIPTNKFAKIITTIISRIQPTNGQVNFSEEELGQLKTLLGFNSEEIDITMSCTAYICDQSAYYNLSDAKLAKQLAEHQLDEQKAITFGQTWGTFKPNFLQQLKDKSFGAPLVLSDVDWKLNLTTSAKDLAKTKQLNGIMTLSLKDANDEGSEKKEAVQLEFNQAQLFELFEKIEILQQQLDNIAK